MVDFNYDEVRFEPDKLDIPPKELKILGNALKILYSKILTAAAIEECIADPSINGTIGNFADAIALETFKFDPSVAICKNVENILFKMGYSPSFICCVYMQDLLKIFTHWEKFSGVKHFPVPCTDNDFNLKHGKIAPQEYFFNCATYCKNFWIGEYGYLRKELLKFTIDKIDSIAIASALNG